MNNNELNKEVTQFLDSSEHPMRNEIEEMRKIIMTTGIPFKENIKWNGPNYNIHSQDPCDHAYKSYKTNPINLSSWSKKARTAEKQINSG